MKIIGWNSRGFGNPQGIRALCDLVGKEVPIILFLLSVVKVEKRFTLGSEGCLAIDNVGRSGGLLLFWKNEVGLTMTKFSSITLMPVLKKRG